MTGLTWFKFYPRDWISGTRGLSDRARGVYIDLLARMYDLGHGLDHDEKDLCRYLNYRDHRQLRPVLRELLDKGKIRLVDGLLINDRAMDEIALADQRSADGKKGGRPPKSAREGHQKGTNGRPAGDQRVTSGRTQGGGFKEKQTLSRNPPEPEPETRYQKERRKGADAPSANGKFRFQGRVISLAETDYERWRKTYTNIPDFDAELQACDDYYADNPPKGGKWFHRASRWLNRANREAKADEYHAII